MEWPPHSLDINTIEHLWYAPKQALQAFSESLKSIFDLWERVQDEWLSSFVETCQNLISSISDKFQAIFKAKDCYTKY